MTRATKALDDLEESKRRFGEGDAKIRRALRVLSKSKVTDADSLIRFHETLLFIRAYPPNATVTKQVERILKDFGSKVQALGEKDADLSPLDDPEISGITGGSVTSNFSYAIVRWLVAKYPAQLSIDWDWFEEEDRFGATMPRFLPLLEKLGQDDDPVVAEHARWAARHLSVDPRM